MNSKFAPKLDLIEARRRLAALRSQHSDNRQIVRLINRRLAKLYHLREPRGAAHEQRLIEDIEYTWRGARLLIAGHSPSGRSSERQHQGVADRRSRD